MPDRILELPESHVIFITRDDALGYGLPIYHIGRKIQEVGENFKDEAYIIYVNSSRQDDTELGRLMHDFYCKDAEDIHSEILAKRVYELKETQEGVDTMCREMDQIYQEGEMKAKKETAINMKKKGYSASTIADLLEVGLNIVQQWVSGVVSLAK